MINDQEIQRLLARAYASMRMSRAVRWVLLTLLVLSLLVMFAGERAESAAGANLVLIVVCVAWVLLSIQSRRKANSTTVASQLIASGQIAHAQQLLGGVCRGLCVHKPVLLLACHNLAITLRKQGQFPAAWQLCELVRSWARKRSNEIRVLSESLRAECSLVMNNLAGAYESLSELSRMSLSVTERLSVIQTEIIYSVRVGRADAVMADLENKVALVSLLPCEQAGMTHGWLALAAELAGETCRKDWLWRRAKLYCPEKEMLEANPALVQVSRARRADTTEGCKQYAQ